MGTYDEEVAKHFQIVDDNYDWDAINIKKDIIAFGWRDFLLFGTLSENKRRFQLCEEFDDMTFNVYYDPDWEYCIETLDMDGHACVYLGLAERTS
jgi:hypothetical protein